MKVTIATRLKPGWRHKADALEPAMLRLVAANNVLPPKLREYAAQLLAAAAAAAEVDEEGAS